MMASAMTQTDVSSRNAKRASGAGQAWKRKPRRHFPIEQKLAVVRACLEPQATLSGVALANGLNANMVRKWVLRYRAGALVARGAATPAMVPVVVRPRRATAPPTPTTSMRDAPVGEVRVEIETAHGVMRVAGAIEAVMLGALLSAMTRG